MPFPGRGSPWLYNSFGARSLLVVPLCFRAQTISPRVLLRPQAKAQPHIAPPTHRRSLVELPVIARMMSPLATSPPARGACGHARCVNPGSALCCAGASACTPVLGSQGPPCLWQSWHRGGGQQSQPRCWHVHPARDKHEAGWCWAGSETRRMDLSVSKCWPWPRTARRALPRRRG